MIIKAEHIGGDFRNSGCSEESCPLWLPPALRGRPRPGGQQQACMCSPAIWKWPDNVLIKCNIRKVTEKNGKRISYQLFYALKLSVRKSGSHQGLVLLTADWKYRKKHSNQVYSSQHFPSCVCFIHTMSPAQGEVIIDLKIYSKSHDKANTCLHWCLELAGGVAGMRGECDKMSRSLIRNQNSWQLSVLGTSFTTLSRSFVSGPIILFFWAMR